MERGVREGRVGCCERGGAVRVPRERVAAPARERWGEEEEGRKRGGEGEEDCESV